MTSVLDGVTVSRRDAEAARADHTASTNRLAASLVRDFAYQHRCHASPWCRHRNHPRDADLDRVLREPLGLPDEIARLEDYDSPLEWASVTRNEALALAHSASSR
jgi:hypothetical protein